MGYKKLIGYDDDLMTIEEFKLLSEDAIYIRYEEGYAHPVKDNLIDTSITVEVDDHSNIPEDATHIVWYNK